MIEKFFITQPDPLLKLINLLKEDNRDYKIDLGVGVYKDSTGRTPVMRCVKLAEQLVIKQQATKAYIGADGNRPYIESLSHVVFGGGRHQRIVGLQTVGGTGALRLAAELIGLVHPNALVLLGEPSWLNHAPILRGVGLTPESHRYINDKGNSIDFEAICDSIRTAPIGAVILLQVCCHNPTGLDFSVEQWRELGILLRKGGIIPLLDLAYQGLGHGWIEDVEGLNALLNEVGEFLLAYSCDKNFGLYRERVGALFIGGEDVSHLQNALSNALSLARASYSMPPDHGAEVVRTILTTPSLLEEWETELKGMRERIQTVRANLASALPESYAFLRNQVGMFSCLPLTPGQIHALRERFAVYVAPNGRINIAGLRDEEIPLFVHALASVEY